MKIKQLQIVSRTGFYWNLIGLWKVEILEDAFEWNVKAEGQIELIYFCIVIKKYYIINIILFRYC